MFFLSELKICEWFYLTIRMWARNSYLLAAEIESEYILIVLVEISEEETKEQQYFFDKQLLNLFK